jgi:ParB-like chromosome segregation protein Spo0J
VEVKSKEIELVDIDLLVENPKNNNKHPKDQIDRLAKIIKAHGFRNPLTVSNRSGFVLCGHGRIAAAKQLGMKQLPIIRQDFENEAEEYAHMTADNAIASWAEIDKNLILEELDNIGLQDIELLGIKDLESLKEPFFEEGSLEDQGRLDQKQMTKCPNCGEEFDHAKNKA